MALKISSIRNKSIDKNIEAMKSNTTPNQIISPAQAVLTIKVLA